MPDVRVDEVWIVPCGNRPFDKPNSSSPNMRLEMTRLAIQDFFPPGFPIKIDTTEIENENENLDAIPTYFLLEKFKKEHPQTEFLFVGGTDLVESIKTWEEGDKLLQETNFVLFEREGYRNNQKMDKTLWPKNFCLVGKEQKMSLFGAISSEEVRSRIKNNTGIFGLVTPSVIQFINKNNLYK